MKNGEYFYEIGTNVKDDKRDLIIIDRKKENVSKNKNKTRNKKMYKIKCNKCGFDSNEFYKGGYLHKEYWIDEVLLKQGTSCPCCNKPSHITVKGINDINTTCKWITKYIKEKEDIYRYSSKSNNSIYFSCPICKITKKLKISDVVRSGKFSCNCNDGHSYGHKFIRSLLKQLGINFEEEKSFKWCKFKTMKGNERKGVYDFCIEDKKMLIEVDGGFHRKDNKMNNTTKEEILYIDLQKDKLAKENGYKIIRIPYEKTYNFNGDKIKKILNKYIEIENVDWRKCEIEALEDSVVKACNMWQDGVNREMIMKMCNIKSKTTLISYLKKGKLMGICDYDIEDEKNKATLKIIKNAKRKAIPIDLYSKDGNFIGSFNSSTELQNKSIEVLGEKLYQAKISRVINKNSKYYGKKYKGYTILRKGEVLNK